MQPPKTLPGLFARIFAAIGTLFSGIGGFGLLNILPLFSQMENNPALVFVAIGLLALAVGLGFHMLESKILQRFAWLQENVTPVAGQIVRVGRQYFFRWNGDSPFVITAEYEVGGNHYRCKSLFFWGGHPGCREEVPVPVLVDPEAPGKAFVDYRPAAE